MDNHTDARDIIDAAQTATMARIAPKERAYTIVPEGSEIVDLESYLGNPVRKRGNVRLSEVASFVSYVRRHAEPGAEIFAAITATGATMTAVLNYHEPRTGVAKWCDHRATYQCVPSEEWKRWLAQNNRWLDQTAFSEFIEDNINDIATPPGAKMLEIAQTLYAKKTVEFKSAVRLDNGDTCLKYVADTKGSAGGNGELEIPQEFTIGIPPFIGGVAFAVGARLRYRINEGLLTLKYELIRPHKVVEAVCKDMLNQVETDTGIEPLIGDPPADV